jgi:hypothetical protein
MFVFDGSTLILIAKAELLDLFLDNASVPVAIPGEVGSLRLLRSSRYWRSTGGTRIRYRGRETEIGGKTVSKTMSVRMDRENYDFLHEIPKQEGSDLSKLCETW